MLERGGLVVSPLLCAACDDVCAAAAAAAAAAAVACVRAYVHLALGLGLHQDHGLRNRGGDLALHDVFADHLERLADVRPLLDQPPQVEHVVDDLERKPGRFEEPVESALCEAALKGSGTRKEKAVERW